MSSAERTIQGTRFAGDVLSETGNHGLSYPQQVLQDYLSQYPNLTRRDLLEACLFWQPEVTGQVSIDHAREVSAVNTISHLFSLDELTNELPLHLGTESFEPENNQPGLRLIDTIYERSILRSDDHLTDLQNDDLRGNAVQMLRSYLKKEFRMPMELRIRLAEALINIAQEPYFIDTEGNLNFINKDKIDARSCQFGFASTSSDVWKKADRMQETLLYVQPNKTYGEVAQIRREFKETTGEPDLKKRLDVPWYHTYYHNWHSPQLRSRGIYKAIKQSLKTISIKSAQ